MTKTEIKLRAELAELLERQRGYSSSYRLADRRSARIKKVREMIKKFEDKRIGRNNPKPMAG